MRRRLRGLALPATAYLSVTVGAPGLNGGLVRAPFWVHAAWVVATCAVVALALAGVQECVERWRRRSRAVAPIGDGRP